ncbi:MAG: GatB/YqeY domain-containing protein [candidate division NC10 bacterium]|nr:GatB/YqeY domain-containing protein [candidate division NC10 bacterium]
MDLKERLALEFNEALKGGDKLKVSVLRLLRTTVKNREVEKRGPLNEAEVIQAIVSSCKQRREAIAEFRQAGREDLASKEEAELKILESFLPEPLSLEELKGKVASAIAETGASSMKDMGKVMAHLLPQVAGRADGKLTSQLVREALAKS